MHTPRQSGHAVDWVKNGAQADCALAAGEFDLLILDLGLPKKSGLDVLRRLRSGDSRLPVLILTALDGASARTRRAGRLVSKDQLVSHLCEWGEEVSPNAIEVYVHRLRKKLEPGGVRIVTVRGLGYSLEKPV